MNKSERLQLQVSSLFNFYLRFICFKNKQTSNTAPTLYG